MLLSPSSQTPTLSLIFIPDLGLASAGKTKLVVVVVGGFTGKQAGGRGGRAGWMIPAVRFPAQSSPQHLRKLLF